MGVIARTKRLLRIGAQAALDEREPPGETLEYGEQRRRELLRTIGEALIEVVAVRQRIARQTDALADQIAALDDRARDAVASGRDDFARITLHRKHELRRALDELERRIAEVAAEQQTLVAAHRRLARDIDLLHARRLTDGARHRSAEARTLAGEALLALGPELAELHLAVGRAEAQTAHLLARAAALEDLLTGGSLPAPLGSVDPRERAFHALDAERAVADDLARFRQRSLPSIPGK